MPLFILEKYFIPSEKFLWELLIKQKFYPRQEKVQTIFYIVSQRTSAVLEEK